MTIRRILLFAFLLVSLVPTATLTLTAFSRTRDAMQHEIEDGVIRSAASVSADFDQMLAERLLNATTWNHLEVMQDLAIGDVDKRLSVFLAELARRYGGAYRALHAVDRSGRVVASSDPDQIGRLRPAGPVWQTAHVPGGTVGISVPDPNRAVRRLELRTPVQSSFGSGEVGELVLEIDWSTLESLLDQSADATRQLLVVDTGGDVIAASAGFREEGLDLGKPAPDFSKRDVILGRQISRGTASFPGFGWTTLLVEPRAVALGPVRRMAVVFATLLGATAIATVLATLGVANVIARPVVALTAFTRDYLRPGPPPTPPVPGPGEIGELQRSFVRLMEDLQRSREALMQASRLAAVGEVTALVAHEVRTPLGILLSSAQMLAQEPVLSSEGRELLNILQSETARLNRLVGSLLDSTRMRTPDRSPTDVHGLMHHARMLLAAQARDRNVTVSVVPDADRAIVSCDGEQITQVLLNLAMNALQVVSPGGRVELRTRNERGRLIVEIADDGPGIPEPERTRIFEPFVFKREGGLGLGLAVVRTIVRGHAGDVAVDRSPLGGALFRVWLPLDDSNNGRNE